MERKPAEPTELEQQVLDLVHHFQEKIGELVDRNPDAPDMLVELQRMEDMVNGRRRLRPEHDDPEKEGALTHDFCGTCEVGRDLYREIDGDHEKVICIICGTVASQLQRQRHHT